LVLCELVPAVICSGFGKTEGSDLQLQDSAPDAAFSQAAGEALQKKTDVMEKQILSRAARRGAAATGSASCGG
jgi:hypothetical protein